MQELMDFKIRCSAISQIMANDRSGQGLGKTAQSYCQQWLKEQLYDRKKEMQTKYTDKGLIMEDTSIDMVADYFNYGMLLKNDIYLENNYITGTADIVLKDKIIDVKNSWSCFSFPLFETKIPDEYYYQGQGYMDLYGKEKFELIYTLTNTPTHLVEREAYFFAKNNGYDELDSEIWEKFVNYHNYDTVPLELRIKRFEFNRDDAVIALIKKRVIECRKYIYELLKQI